MGQVNFILTGAAKVPPLGVTVGLAVSAASFIPLVPAVRVIATVNAAAGNPEGVNDRYSAANIATIAVGAFVYFILIVATILGF